MDDLKKTAAKIACALSVVALTACAAKPASYPYTNQERALDADRKLLMRVVACEQNTSRRDFDQLAVRLGAHRAIHEINSTKPEKQANVDYLFPRGLMLFGLPVTQIAARTEVVPAGPYKHRFTSYTVKFGPEVTGEDVRQRLNLRDENERGHGAGRTGKGMIKQHDLVLRHEAGQEHLACGYEVRTLGRFLKDAS